MRIVRLEVENVKGIKAVQITPDSNMVVVGGENDEGKSSLLDSIMYALGGKGTLPPEPLRKGERKGHINVRLDGDEPPGLRPITVSRTFDAKGHTTLKITGDDGSTFPKPQTLIEEFYQHATFDPHGFARQSPKDQVATLMTLTGLDFTEADAERKGLYDERTAVNREVRSLQVRLDAATTYEDAPDKEVSIAVLSTELTRRIEANREVDDAHARLATRQRGHGEIGAETDAAAATVARLQRELSDAIVAATRASQASKESRDALASYHQEVETLVMEDTDEIQSQITTAEETNQQVRANQAAKTLDHEYKVKVSASDGLTSHIEDIDADKTRRIAAAEFPVPGLGFGEDCVTFDDLPLDQASSSAKITVSTEIGFALNPRLPIALIRDGALLGDGRVAEIAAIAEKHGGQVWIEVVGDPGGCSVVIEDGRVREETPEAEPATTGEES